MSLQYQVNNSKSDCLSFSTSWVNDSSWTQKKLSVTMTHNELILQNQKRNKLVQLINWIGAVIEPIFKKNRLKNFGWRSDGSIKTTITNQFDSGKSQALTLKLQSVLKSVFPRNSLGDISETLIKEIIQIQKIQPLVIPTSVVKNQSPPKKIVSISTPVKPLPRIKDSNSPSLERNVVKLTANFMTPSAEEALFQPANTKESPAIQTLKGNTQPTATLEELGEKEFSTEKVELPPLSAPSVKAHTAKKEQAATVRKSRSKKGNARKKSKTSCGMGGLKKTAVALAALFSIGFSMRARESNKESAVPCIDGFVNNGTHCYTPYLQEYIHQNSPLRVIENSIVFIQPACHITDEIDEVFSRNQSTFFSDPWFSVDPVSFQFPITNESLEFCYPNETTAKTDVGPRAFGQQQAPSHTSLNPPLKRDIDHEFQRQFEMAMFSINDTCPRLEEEVSVNHKTFSPIEQEEFITDNQSPDKPNQGDGHHSNTQGSGAFWQRITLGGGGIITAFSQIGTIKRAAKEALEFYRYTTNAFGKFRQHLYPVEQGQQNPPAVAEQQTPPVIAEQQAPPAVAEQQAPPAIADSSNDGLEEDDEDEDYEMVSLEITTRRVGAE